MNYLITNVRNVYEYFYQLPENFDLFDGSLMFADYLVDGDDTIILSLVDNKIIGFCLLHNEIQNYWVKQAVSVMEKYRNQGIAKKMLTLAHHFVKNRNGKMMEGNYTQDGYKYLHKINMQFKTIYVKI